MQKIRSLIGVFAALASLAIPASRAVAQGVTTGALTGLITDADGQVVESAQIQLRNPLTGYNIGAITRANGTFSIQGIEPNSNYRITVRRIGFAPITRDGIVITLGQTRREDFKLVREVSRLAEVSITASTTDAVINTSKLGTSSTISDSLLRRLPTLNRNFSDFVNLVPQVSNTGGVGLSGAGVNLRQNSIQIDGAQSNDVFGLGTSGQPGSSANAKSIPLDAVKEYQVLLSPFDVRQGNFGGLLINAVTKSGTNEFHGTVYSDFRNQNFSRTSTVNTNFNQKHYAGSLGGPIVKDKLFFFASGEFQQRQFPASGSYIGAPDQYIAQSSIDAVNSALQAYGLQDGGTGEQITKQNPNRNAFVRFDAYLPMSTRMVLRDNYASADNTTFSRSLASSNSPLFNLTSNKYELSNKSNSAVLELLTNTSSGVYNEFLANYATIKDFRTVPVLFPQITVRGITRSDASSGTASIVAGTESSSQGNTLDQRTIELTDNVTLPFGAHAVTVGGKMLRYRSINLFGQNSLGNWTFNSLAALQAGTPASYSVSAPLATDPALGLATINAATYAGYIEDAWQATPTLSLNFGVRIDKPVFADTPPENPSVLADYGRSTSSVPHEAQISPRFGFNWDVTGDQKNQLRGGAGSFTGPAPFVYLSNAFGNSGLSGFASLNCSGSTTGATSLAAPAFTPATAAAPPTSCAAFGAKPGASIATSASINTIDPAFKNPKYLKATLGFDHRFANGFIGTLEGLYSKSQNNAFYQNLALAGPQGVDTHGRTLYGTLTANGGTATFKTTTSNRTTVLDVTNSNGDYTYSLTGQLQKSFTDNFEGSLAYTHQVARDVVSVTSSTAGSNYRYQRDVSGLLSDMTVSRSKYDQPHRIIATGTYHFKSATDVSFIYTGNSGSPYDYVYGSGSTSGSGDANADGQTQNDLVYVPKTVNDPNEILFTGYNAAAGSTARAQADSMAAGFDNLINSVQCLREARGTILTRNACRNPWVNEVDVSIGQSLGRLAGKTFENLQVRLDIINFGNLLNKDWGKQAFSDQNSTCGPICSATLLLTQTGNALPTGVTTNSPLAQGIYTFDYKTFQPYNTSNLSSLYTLQLSLRYSF